MLRPEPRRGGRPAAAYGPESHQPGPYEPGRNQSDRYGAPRYEYGPAPVPPETPYGPTGVPYGGIAAPFDEIAAPYDDHELPEDPGGPGGHVDRCPSRRTAHRVRDVPRTCSRRGRTAV